MMLRVESLNSGYGRIAVLRDVSLEICLLYTSPSPRDS